MLDWTRNTIRAAGGEVQAGKRISIHLGLAGSQFTPGDVPVVVGVEADRRVEVAQGDRPLQSRIVTAGDDRHIARAGTVCPCGEGQQARQRDAETSAHHEAISNWWTRPASVTSSTKFA